MACSRDTINCKIERDKNRPPCCIEGFKNLLFYIVDLFEKNGITYWLDYGTLLGAVRKGEIIPWDTDIDLGTLDIDVEKICSLKDQILDDGYDFLVHQVDGPQIATSDDVVDPKKAHTIFIFYSKVNRLSLEIPIWEVDAKYSFNYTRRWYGKGERAIGKAFCRLYLLRPNEIEMYGKKFICPNKTEQFLAYRFGPKWKTEIRG